MSGRPSVDTLENGLNLHKIHEPAEASQESCDLGGDNIESKRLRKVLARMAGDRPKEKGCPRESKKGLDGRTPRKRPELRVRHSVHDRLQMESDLTFDLRPRGPFENRRKFKVDLFLYLPYALGVNSTNFHAEEYFRHWTSYFRVRAPLYHQWRVLPPELLSFPSVEEYFAQHLSTFGRQKLGPRVIQEVKLFGNFLYTELKKLRSSLPKKKKPKDEKARRHLAEELEHRILLLWSFREFCLAPVRDSKFLVDEDVQRAFFLTDEYLSYRAELVLLRARDALPDHAERLHGLLEKEIDYRAEHGLLILGEGEDRTVPFEAYTYRLGLLKKYLGEPLFLQAISDKKDTLYKNYAAAVGAGLAALIAGLVEHQRVQYLTGNDSGMRLAFLIGVAVLAYIFKDRVKELSRDYFSSRLRERLPDQRYLLSHQSVLSDGKKDDHLFGTASEYLRFVPEAPADVAYLRTLGQIRASDPVRREHILQIARRFDLEVLAEDKSQLFPLLKNVVRLDISPFLSKLDNPTMPVSYFNKDSKARTAQAPKVYHLNAVFRYETILGPQESKSRVDYERVRLIINKNGIVRLETIVKSGQLAYLESHR